MATVFEPIRPVPPMTTIFMVYTLRCRPLKVAQNRPWLPGPTQTPRRSAGSTEVCNAHRGGAGGWRFHRILHFHGDGVGQIGASRQLETRVIGEAFAMAARAFAGREIFRDEARAVALQNAP